MHRSDLARRSSLGAGSKSHPATVTLRALAHEAVVTEDGPHPLAELGTIAARCKRRRSHGPCHPRATSSVTIGMQRSMAVTREGRCAGRWALT
jgi:hypothetical protein